MNDLVKIIDVLRGGDFYGAGEFTEIAKGKKELVKDWRSIKRKIIRKSKA